MHEYVIPVVIGIFSSMSASIIFILFLYSYRPKIIISPDIAKNIDVYGDQVYDFKVINKSKRAVININAELLLVTKENVPDGQINTTKRIDMVHGKAFILKKKNSKRFPVKENIEQIWENDSISFLMFRIYVEDSLTGFGTVIDRKYYTKNSIKNGKHGALYREDVS